MASSSQRKPRLLVRPFGPRRLAAILAGVFLLASACSAPVDPQISETYQARVEGEAALAEAEQQRIELEAQLAQAEADAEAERQQLEEQERLEAEAQLEAALYAEYEKMATVVTSRVNELSLIGLDQDCLADGFQTEGIAPITDPGRPLAEFDATRVSYVMVECGALQAYMTNLNQLGLGPTLTDQERECLTAYVGDIAGSDFQLLLTSELMGEAGVIASATYLDGVYNATWDAVENCNINDW